MRLLTLLIVVALAFTGYAVASYEAAYEPAKVYPHGGVEGGDALVLPLGDIQGIRNIQCGRHTGVSRDLNCDIGAGSTEHPGVVAFNWDVGRAVVIYDGRRRKVASFSGRGIVFYRRPRVRR